MSRRSMEWNVYKWSVGLFFSRVALRPQKPHTAYYGLGGAEGLEEGTALTSVSTPLQGRPDGITNRKEAHAKLLLYIPPTFPCAK